MQLSFSFIHRHLALLNFDLWSIMYTAGETHFSQSLDRRKNDEGSDSVTPELKKQRANRCHRKVIKQLEPTEISCLWRSQSVGVSSQACLLRWSIQVISIATAAGLWISDYFDSRYPPFCIIDQLRLDRPQTVHGAVDQKKTRHVRVRTMRPSKSLCKTRYRLSPQSDNDNYIFTPARSP